MARPKAGSNFSISQLESLLMTKKRDLAALAAERQTLLKHLSEIDSRITSLGGTASGYSPKKMGRPPGSTSAKASGLTAGGRARNAKSLVETLIDVVGAATEPMKVGDIVDGVLKSGYKTGSDNFRGIVNQTLIKERKHFASAGRGLYTGKAKK